MSTHSTRWIYFIHAPTVGRIKIGFASGHPDRRFKICQTHSPCELVKLGAIVTDMLSEAHVHRQFASLRDQGEWFRAEPELLDFIAQRIPPWPDAPAVSRHPSVFDNPDLPKKRGRKSIEFDPVRRARNVRIAEAVLVQGIHPLDVARGFGVSRSAVFAFVRQAPSYPEGKHLRHLVNQGIPCNRASV